MGPWDEMVYEVASEILQFDEILLNFSLNPRLKITESSVSGFSNGARWAANIMAVEPHLFRASAILGG